MPVRLPLLAQELKCALGHRNIAIPIALAGADVQQHPLGVDIADLQAQSFPQAQAAGINGAQAHPMIQRADAGEDGAHFAGGKHDRQFELRIGPSQLQFVGPGAVEGFFPEQFDGTDGLGAWPREAKPFTWLVWRATFFSDLRWMQYWRICSGERRSGDWP